ncbi:MAG TPA: DUF456 domain-containing protein [Mycobacteriales bacterium]|jgi:uncharacterized protein YqgC (DUF456 family)|nr:DUF456 domain-containing protein [Mycobacteriales bacterium]
MSGGAQTLVGLVMVAGIVGILLPVLPGLLMIWAAGLWWTIADGGGATRWVVFAVLTGLLVVGTVVKYVLPARSAAARGAPFSTLAIGAVGAIAGFFVIPVVGLLIGGVLGIYLAEYVRLHDPGRAWTSTRAALVAIGIGLLIELTAGVLMFGVWLLGVWVT